MDNNNNFYQIYFHARRLRAELERFSPVPRPTNEHEEDEWGPYHPCYQSADIEKGLADSNLTTALEKFCEAMDQGTIGAHGSFNFRYLSETLAGPCVAIQGDLDEETYDHVQSLLGATAGGKLEEFGIGLGAAGTEILISFLTSVSAAAFYELVKYLLSRRVEMAVSEQAAIKLCCFDLFTTSGREIDADQAVCIPSRTPHAKFEVEILDQHSRTLYAFLVRGNGEICGRHTRALPPTVDQPTTGSEDDDPR